MYLSIGEVVGLIIVALLIYWPWYEQEQKRKKEIMRRRGKWDK